MSDLSTPPPPVISVLLPVFNGCTTLKASLDSVLQQTYRNFEVLVIDDGSADGSGDLARSLGDPRVRVIGNAERHGLAARLNEGIAAAQGHYLARMDADDLAFPDRFAKQVAFLDAHPDIDLVGCRALVFDNKGEIIGLLPFAAQHEEICTAPWRNIPLPHPTWMGRAAWFRHHKYAVPETKRAEDQELLLRSYATSRFACLDEILLAYRQNKFRLRPTLKARGYLLAAQLHHFARRRQIKNALLALFLTTVKITLDLAAALPLCDKLFFMRMKGCASAQTLEEFEQLKPKP